MQGAFQVLFEGAAVAEAGQGVGESLTLDALQMAAEFGHFARGSVQRRLYSAARASAVWIARAAVLMCVYTSATE